MEFVPDCARVLNAALHKWQLERLTKLMLDRMRDREGEPIKMADFTVAPQTSVTPAVEQAAKDRAMEIKRLDAILFVLENLPDINRIERKIDLIGEDVAKLKSNLVPNLVSGEDYQQTGRKPDQTPWDAKKPQGEQTDEPKKSPQTLCLNLTQ